MLRISYLQTTGDKLCIVFFHLLSILSFVFLQFSAAAQANIPTDCNTLSDTPIETFICTYPQLKKINLQLKNLLEKAKTENAADVEKLDNFIYRKNQTMNSCEDSKCLVGVMKEIYSGINEKKYLFECPKPEIDAACEVYVVGDQNKNNLNKDLFLTEEEFTSMRKLRVNLPEQCVYLIINNLYPAIWDIYATPETDIREIIAASNFPQMIRGHA